MKINYIIQMSNHFPTSAKARVFLFFGLLLTLNAQQSCEPITIILHEESPLSLSLNILVDVNTCTKDSLELSLYNEIQSTSIIPSKSARKYTTTRSNITVEDSIFAEKGQPLSFFRHRVILDDLQPDTTYTYTLDGKPTGSFKTFSNEDVRVLFLSGMLDQSGENRLQMIASVERVLKGFTNETVMVVDLTSQDETVRQSAEEKVQYLRDIGNITKGYRYMSVNQNDTSFINRLLKTEVRDSKEYVKVIPLTNKSDLVLVDSQLLFSQIYADIESQKEALRLIQSDQSVSHFYAIDKPLYCSGLSEKCTSQATVYKTTYQSTFFNPEQPPRPLVISGSADTYERTFPKFDQRHQEYEDPTTFVDPEFPTFINLNGLKSLPEHQQWLLQKQQWSAYMRKILTFGLLSLSPTITYFTTFDITGREIDELSLIFTNKELSFLEAHAPIIAYAFCFSMALAFLKLTYSSFIPRLVEHSKMIQDQIKGIDRGEGSAHRSSDEEDSEDAAGEEDESSDDGNLSGHRSGEGEEDSEDEAERRPNAMIATETQPLREIEMTEIDLSTKRED
ncbi:hypothetical protein FGO68_gene4049 [Halteria grandinella]|uniref:Uncharacterized protein n=1 Tax=Halteria grandinella TaxID=5974 RepID=A0A8J8T305_HALGN|nr:hypothetical protein FGO68_gene4049 [Halteria grandinella]